MSVDICTPDFPFLYINLQVCKFIKQCLLNIIGLAMQPAKPNPYLGIVIFLFKFTCILLMFLCLSGEAPVRDSAVSRLELLVEAAEDDWLLAGNTSCTFMSETVSRKQSMSSSCHWPSGGLSSLAEAEHLLPSTKPGPPGGGTSQQSSNSPVPLWLKTVRN